MPSVGGNITAKSVQPQGEIPELGRTKKGKMTELKKVMGEITKRSFYQAPVHVFFRLNFDDEIWLLKFYQLIFP